MLRWIKHFVSVGLLSVIATLLAPAPSAADSTTLTSKSPTQLKDSCDAGDATNCTELGVRYINGTGVKKDSVTATQLFTQSCGRKDAEGCFYLSMIFGKGIDGTVDNARAIKHMDEACSLGSPRGCTFMGKAYERAPELVSTDKARAADYYKKACGLGETESCAALSALNKPVTPPPVVPQLTPAQQATAWADEGYKHDTGKGVPVDKARAAQLYKSACDGGNIGSCFNLGLMYDLGRGVTQNKVYASRLYNKACNAGDADSCTNLGLLYHNGEGVAKNNTYAAQFYTKGCDGGHRLGCRNLGIMYERGELGQVNLKSASQFYAKACQNGLKDSCAARERVEARANQQSISQPSPAVARPNLTTNPTVLSYEAKPPQKPFEPKERLENECKAGKAISCNALGNLLIEHEEFGYRLDATYYYETACKLNYAFACRNLGAEYYNGNNIRHDYSNSINFAEKGCKLNDRISCKNLIEARRALAREEEDRLSQPQYSKFCEGGIDLGTDLSGNRICHRY
jgi:uncharacterized protein